MKREVPLADVLTLLRGALEERLRCRIVGLSKDPSRGVAAIVEFLDKNSTRILFTIIIYKDDTFAFEGEVFLRVLPEDIVVMGNAMKRCTIFMDIFGIKPKTDSL